MTKKNTFSPKYPLKLLTEEPPCKLHLDTSNPLKSFTDISPRILLRKTHTYTSYPLKSCTDISPRILLRKTHTYTSYPLKSCTDISPRKTHLDTS